MRIKTKTWFGIGVIALVGLLAGSIFLAWHRAAAVNEEVNPPASAAQKQLWTCGMHPDVIQDHPGNCPLCGMNLTPVKSSASGVASGSKGPRKIKYWVAPMDPTYISDKPGKSPMGMDLVPVYDDQSGGGSDIVVDPSIRQTIGVRTERVTLKDLSMRIRTNGLVVEPENKVAVVNSKVNGWVEKLFVSRTGDQVRKGEPLLEIYSPDLVSAQEEFVVALHNADALNNAAGDASNLVESARRRLELWDISTEQIDELQTSRRVKRTMIFRSPADGIVLEKDVFEGDAVKKGMNLFRIADLRTIWVKAQVYEHELPWIRQGDQVEIISPYDHAPAVKGELEYIYPTVNPKSRTVDVRIVLPNPNLRFKPEMYVDAVIQAGTVPDAVAVPKQAVLRSGRRDLAFVDVGDGHFEPREVKLGFETDDDFQIVEGLAPGESVVTSAQFLLDSEAKLQESIQRRLRQRQMAKDAGAQ